MGPDLDLALADPGRGREALDLGRDLDLDLDPEDLVQSDRLRHWWETASFSWPRSISWRRARRGRWNR